MAIPPSDSFPKSPSDLTPAPAEPRVTFRPRANPEEGYDVIFRPVHGRALTLQCPEEHKAVVWARAWIFLDALDEGAVADPPTERALRIVRAG